MNYERQNMFYNAQTEANTVYLKAKQEWDNRIGSARVQAKNWRLIAFFLLLMTFGLLALVFWQTLTSKITPYIVEIKQNGSVQAIAKAEKLYQPTDAQIAYHLAQLIKNFRELSTDPVVVRKNWLTAYNYVTGDAANTLSENARKNSPFQQIGKQTVSVDITSVVRASRDSFNIRWIEKSYKNGVLVKTGHYTSILSILMKQPDNAETLKKNPLGIYVTELNWSKDLPTGDKS